MVIFANYLPHYMHQFVDLIALFIGFFISVIDIFIHKASHKTKQSKKKYRKNILQSAEISIYKVN
jgi:hypothetical protein